MSKFLYYFLPLGLKASFSPSPTKLILKIVNVIINAGGIQIQGFELMISPSYASLNIFPHEGIDLLIPKPKKLNPDSTTIIPAKVNVA